MRTWTTLAFCAMATVARGGLLDYYGYPATDEFPDSVGKVYFAWPTSDTDAYSQADALDLRSLNEAVAGQEGWVTHADGRFLRADGTPLRFWAVNVTGSNGYSTALAQGKFLAKRGVNLARIHGGAAKSLFSKSSASLSDVNSSVISQAQAVVSAMKQSGIYSMFSNSFFIIELSLKGSYGVAGYTNAWLSANPDKAEPYGLIFLDDTLRAAYRNWITELMTRPNPNDPENKPLAQDTGLAIVEILNEDNVFFSTFNPDDWPPEQQEIQEKRFFQWVGEKYLDPETYPGDTVASAAARALQTVWYNRKSVRDDVQAGRFQLKSAVAMTLSQAIVLPRNRDQVEYLAFRQREFFEEMTQLLRDLGYGGTVSATNWKTASDAKILDLELSTYTAAGVVDRHNYYSPQSATQAQFFAVSPGDQFFAHSALLNPRESPLTQKHVDGFPLTISEQAWVQYTTVQGEAPLAVATYMALGDVDGWMWFALDTRTWNTGSARSWVVENPGTLGQFPGAALLYRRGDVAEAGVVMREGRTPQSLVSLESSKLFLDGGFDVFRDSPRDFENTPAPGPGSVDPAITLVGRAVLDTTTDEDMVLPEAAALIDPDTGTIDSITGQVRLHTGTGVLITDTPQAQGAVGFLRSHGPVESADCVFEMENKHGAVLAIALDDAPLRASRKIFVQAFSSDRRVNAQTQRIPMTFRNEAVTGLRIQSAGSNGYEVERINASVRFKGLADRWIRARALDTNLYPKGLVTAVKDGNDVVMTLPEDSLYTFIELQAPVQTEASVLTRMLPNARIGAAYAADLRSTGSLGTWSQGPGAPALPAGLELQPNGTLAGSPTQPGYYELSLELREGSRVLDAAVIPLVVEPLPSAGPWGTPSNVFRHTGMGLVYDLNLPYLRLVPQAEWLYLAPDPAAEGGYHLYRFGGGAGGPGWIWWSEKSGVWYYDYTLAQWAHF